MTGLVPRCAWGLASAFVFVLAVLVPVLQAQRDPGPPPADKPYPNVTNMTTIDGTWSSGTGAVLTGPKNVSGQTHCAMLTPQNFFNPFLQQFTIPKTAGVSFSFTPDNFFESAKYQYNSDRACRRECEVLICSGQTRVLQLVDDLAARQIPHHP